MRTQIGVRHCIIGCITGISVFLGLGFLSGINPSMERAVGKLMLPGDILGTMFGAGRDDVLGVVMLLGGNAVLYCLLFIVIFRLILGPATPRDRTRPSI